jgi:hypothetical protein
MFDIRCGVGGTVLFRLDFGNDVLKLLSRFSEGLLRTFCDGVAGTNCALYKRAEPIADFRKKVRREHGRDSDQHARDEFCFNKRSCDADGGDRKRLVAKRLFLRTGRDSRGNRGRVSGGRIIVGR